MKVLFVCKHNRFRSKVAEAYFKKINKNKNIEASSAGIYKGIPVDKKVITIGKKLGININSKTKYLDEKKFIMGIDLVIIVANNVPASLFGAKGEKVIQWRIPDKITSVSLIMKKVDSLVKQLESAK